MRKSKLLTVLVAAAIGVSMVGCGSSGGSSSSGSGASSSGGDVANKDKPLCWYNRQPSNSSTGELDKTALTFNDKTYYVGFDANQGAELQGQMVVDYIKKHIDKIDRNGDGVIGYVLAIGDIGHNDSIARTCGVRSQLGTAVDKDGSVDSSPAGTNVDGTSKVVKDAKLEVNGKTYTIRELASQEMKNSAGATWGVAMGRAIVRDPKVFLMDEPLSNLDAKLRGQMRIEISKLHQRLGTTIIYVTHDQTEAMTLGTRIVVMNAGIVQQVDTPQTLYDYPCNQFVAGFIGSPQMNFVDAKCKVVGNKVYLVAGPSEIELPPAKAKKLIDGGYEGKTVVLGIRPEDVHDEQMFIETSPNTVIEAKIRVYEMLGAEVFLYFDYEGSSMTARVDPRTTARTGDIVKFALDAEKIHIFDKETQVTITN